jgi:predicted nucleic-acid-binding protein
MRSLDTNVLARFFIDDPDDAQAARQRPAAVAALSDRAWVSVTVLLEFEWVMRGFYRLPIKQVAQVLRALAGIAHVSLEDHDAVLLAVEGLEKGLDFADALHLARSAAHATVFATFDKDLARRATRATVGTPVPAVELLR